MNFDPSIQHTHHTRYQDLGEDQSTTAATIFVMIVAVIAIAALIVAAMAWNPWGPSDNSPGSDDVAPVIERQVPIARDGLPQ